MPFSKVTFNLTGAETVRFVDRCDSVNFNISSFLNISEITIEKGLLEHIDGDFSIEELILRKSTIPDIGENVKILSCFYFLTERVNCCASSFIADRNIIVLKETYMLNVVLSSDSLCIIYETGYSEFNKKTFDFDKTQEFSFLVDTDNNTSILLSSDSLTVRVPTSIHFINNEENVASIRFWNLSKRSFIGTCNITSDHSMINVFDMSHADIPNAFIFNSSFVIINPIDGHYCLANEETIGFCSNGYEPILFKHLEINTYNFTTDSNKLLTIELAQTSEKNRPVVSLKGYVDLSINIHSYNCAKTRNWITILADDENPLNEVVFSDIAVYLFAVNDITTETLILRNTEIKDGKMLSPKKMMKIDENSSEFLSMITKLSQLQTYPNRDVIVCGNISAIRVFEQSITVIWTKVFSFSIDMMSWMIVETTSPTFNIDYADAPNKSVLIIPDVLCYANTTSVLFMAGWDFFTFELCKVTSIIRSDNNISFFSEIPLWPEAVFNTCNHTVHCSNGGNYCIFSDYNECPSNSLMIHQTRVLRTMRLYADVDTGVLNLTICSTTEDECPVIDLVRVINLKVLNIAGINSYIKLDASKMYLFNELYLSRISCIVISRDMTLFHVLKTVVNEKSTITFQRNARIMTNSLVIYNPNHPCLESVIERKELTAVKIYVNKDLTKVFFDQNCMLFTRGEEVFNYSNSYLSFMIIIKDSFFTGMFIIDASPFVTINAMPVIGSIIPTSLSVLFTDSFYTLRAGKVGWFKEPSTGEISFSSNMGEPPQSFSIPPEGDNVKYKFQSTPQPTAEEKEEEHASMKMTIIMYYLSVFVIFGVAFFFVCAAVSCQKSPELPPEVLIDAMTSIPSLQEEI